jgi:hypothetical protein
MRKPASWPCVALNCSQTVGPKRPEKLLPKAPSENAIALRGCRGRSPEGAD